MLGVFHSTRGSCSSVVGEVEVTYPCKVVFFRISFNISSHIVLLYGTSRVQLAWMTTYLHNPFIQ